VTEALLPVGQLSQIGIVVRDLETAMRHYWHVLGIGPWRVYTYGDPVLKEMTYRGKAQPYRMRLALTQAGPLIVELIQSLEGPNIYDEFLDRHGEGLHHVMTIVDDFDATVAKLRAAGYEMLQSGRGFGANGDGDFAYFDTTADLGTIYEVVAVPKVRLPPEMEYPP
jgi:methylmalonyl-CoA/ethylmalonyl-CoA epimerase